MSTQPSQYPISQQAAMEIDAQAETRLSGTKRRGRSAKGSNKKPKEQESEPELTLVEKKELELQKLKERQERGRRLSAYPKNKNGKKVDSTHINHKAGIVLPIGRIYELTQDIIHRNDDPTIPIKMNQKAQLALTAGVESIYEQAILASDRVRESHGNMRLMDKHIEEALTLPENDHIAQAFPSYTESLLEAKRAPVYRITREIIDEDGSDGDENLGKIVRISLIRTPEEIKEEQEFKKQQRKIREQRAKEKETKRILKEQSEQAAKPAKTKAAKEPKKAKESKSTKAKKAEPTPEPESESEVEPVATSKKGSSSKKGSKSKSK